MGLGAAWLVSPPADQSSSVDASLPLLPSIQLHLCTHVSAHVYTRVCTRLYTCLYTCLYTYLFTHTRICTHMSAHMSIHMSTHVYTCLNTCLHTCLYTCPYVYTLLSPAAGYGLRCGNGLPCMRHHCVLDCRGDLGSAVDNYRYSQLFLMFINIWSNMFIDIYRYLYKSIGNHRVIVGDKQCVLWIVAV